MKKLLLAAALLAAFAAKAQTTTYGFTGSLGAFKTINSSSSAGADFNYAPGLQLQLGSWVQLPVSEKATLQLTLVHSIERQGGSKVTMTDENRNPLANVKTRYGNLAIGATAVYLRHLSDKLALGAGAGVTYKYVSLMAVQDFKMAGIAKAELAKTYDDRYHRKFNAYLPVEVQYGLSPRVTLRGQLQVPLSNRIAASESAFKERDLGLAVGVNYILVRQ
ncbi:hypothetical protein [Pontibacter liquoris]|uniref:hypothetical protein n=1 Tax=Pontibacter liquoris TaxID=2905677 RepID=UPI001FA81869|nr:hypothetical protein [Pontibacter liquoris]